MSSIVLRIFVIGVQNLPWRWDWEPLGPIARNCSTTELMPSARDKKHAFSPILWYFGYFGENYHFHDVHLEFAYGTVPCNLGVS